MMKGKRRPEYLVFAIGFALLSILCTVFLMIKLFVAGTPGSLDDRGKAMVARAEQLTGTASCAASRIDGGMYSLSDYLVSVFESPKYQLSCEDNSRFARDLVNVIYGESDTSRELDISAMCSASTRQYAVNSLLKDIDRSYRTTGKVNGSGGFSGEVMLSEEFSHDGRVLMGIKTTTGVIRYEGKDIRADVLVDGALCHGCFIYKENSRELPDGAKEFELSWDTSESSSGNHDISIIFRNAGGVSSILRCGKTDIPEFDLLDNDRAVPGTLPSGTESMWYRFNCEDRDAYVNFAGMSRDIKVSLYDLFGNNVGTNDLKDSEYEVLRGKAQDIAAAVKETGIEGISNCFYVRVERSSGVPLTDDVNYTMLTSCDAVRYNGTYMAVVQKDDQTVRMVDENNDLFEAETSDITLLPLNGTLYDMSVKDASSGEKMKIWPGFDSATMEYAYYLREAVPVTVSAVSLEGYASEVTITKDGRSGSDTGDGTLFELSEGINTVNVHLKSFSGEEKEYSLYFLCGDDGSSFARNTLSKFPESYYSGLILLHIQHPEYAFTAYNVGVNFEDVVEVQDSGGRSLATFTYNPSYVKPDSRIYDAPDWMAVKPEVIRYYLDPRNFLTVERVFMFERQSFNPLYHTRDGIRSMISGSFMDTDEYNYVEAIYNAAETSGVSPYLLASRILQEMGFNGASNLAHGTVSGYEGYYNYYNIGAYASTEAGGPVLNGAKYARWGSDPDAQEITEREAGYLLPWDSIDKAITGGALWIANGYINNGQDTLYFQKFDVVDNGTALYDHQYAGYIMMAYSEGYRYYKSYLNTNQLGNSFEFVIPVYNNMPQEFGVKP